MNDTYVLACRTPWGLEAFARRRAGLPGVWHVLTDKADLRPGILDTLKPRYVFFPHWSWIVPQAIVEAHECVCFHMTDLPYGRGGSPLQNLILSGHRDTQLTALRMDSGVDTGPVYMKAPLELSGSAEDIYRRATELSFEMIAALIKDELTPKPQAGEPTPFRRRRPEDSRMPAFDHPEALYDFIRMLDAEGYPHAFTEAGGWRYQLTNAQLTGDSVKATVRITRSQAEEAD